ncbi:lipoprotein [Mycoplasmoides pneumoniae]|uniref:lipoprotein n=1 Tax=Mycoplasmoides pneumoniae TaxID=2104 RepID=UPI0002B84A28|nr:lipoprotein [Mycoplasmoides pneumoniae]AGC04158.1 hypothetical protein C985_0231 [Mycoplasmoides pneumoniae M129-B7]ALA30116.1 hypothetical protein C897_01320 [Mycoplasmoides pneumoniae PI 1428]ALA32227.1 hypothetical protein F533_01320 [Mycoplasmoides pneumoniae 51494]ALA32928.1 hypothetical protein F530_01320 [Mycoplasmoides pneumoniae 54089]ALA33631.1 hypothetical protein F531_01320 [Mycoplasmoides pneumoniae 54524]
MKYKTVKSIPLFLLGSIVFTACSTPQSTFHLPVQTTVSAIKKDISGKTATAVKAASSSSSTTTSNDDNNQKGYFLETNRSTGTYDPNNSTRLIKLGESGDFHAADQNKPEEALFERLYGGIASLLNFRIIKPALTYWNTVTPSLKAIGKSSNLITFSQDIDETELQRALANNLIVADDGNNNFWFGLKSLSFNAAKLTDNAQTQMAQKTTQAVTLKSQAQMSSTNTKNTNKKIDLRDKITLSSTMNTQGSGDNKNPSSGLIQKLVSVENIEAEFSFVKTGFNGNEIKFGDFVTENSPTTTQLKQVWKKKWGTELKKTNYKLQLNNFSLLLTYTPEVNKVEKGNNGDSNKGTIATPNGFSFLYPANLNETPSSSSSYWTNVTDLTKAATDTENTNLLNDLQKSQEQVNQFVAAITQNHLDVSEAALTKKQFGSLSISDFFKAIFKENGKDTKAKS